MQNTKQEVQTCQQCGADMTNEKIIWDENGYGYSTKLCRCPECSTLNVIKYYEDCSLDLNKDTRYYEYTNRQNKQNKLNQGV